LPLRQDMAQRQQGPTAGPARVHIRWCACI